MSALQKLSEKDKAVINSIFNPTLPSDDLFETDNENEETFKEDREIVELELAAIKNAENKNYSDSLDLFKRLIDLLPNRAATFNNRAQVYRLMGDTTSAFDDLNKAIALANDNVKILRQALCQRGILYKKEGKDQEAKDDFSKAAKLGSPFAKQQIIEMNPYAALCNQMLTKAFQQLK